MQPRAQAKEVNTSARPVVILALIVLWAGGLIARLAFWQVMQHGTLAADAAREHAALSVQTASRGSIVDADGMPLATDITLNQVYAVPKWMRDPTKTAEALSPLVGVSATTLERIFSSYSGYNLLAQKVDPATSTAIQKLALPGIVLTPMIQRDYPGGTVASQIVGYVGGDNRGDAGLEQYYQQVLSGSAGLRSVLKDTAGDSIHVGGGPSVAPQNGGELQLTLNGAVQEYAQEELNKAVRKHNADGGSVIVMDPRTGAILAMANTPTYNPNSYSRYSYSRFLNPAIQSTYEPGSTFKIVTMAAGLDTHTITPDTAFDDTGQFRVADTVLHNWNMSGFGLETMTQVLQHSANVGAAWVSQRLGRNAFYKYVRAFGIGQSTGVDLPNEAPGSLPLPGERSWTIVNQFTNAFGQGLTTTPLQLIHAVAAVANDGRMMQPQIVRKETYDGRLIVRRPVSQGQVISPQTAHTLTNMLVHSAIDGEASLALVKGYDIAAKTGTANVASPTGGYIQGDTIASVVGYAPAESPRFIVLVKIDHPRDSPWGSMVAAPVLHNIFQELFMYYHVPPSPNALNK